MTTEHKPHSTLRAFVERELEEREADADAMHEMWERHGAEYGDRMGEVSGDAAEVRRALQELDSLEEQLEAARSEAETFKYAHRTDQTTAERRERELREQLEALQRELWLARGTVSKSAYDALHKQLEALQTMSQENYDAACLRADQAEEQLEATQQTLLEVAQEGYERVLQKRYEELLEQVEAYEKALEEIAHTILFDDRERPARLAQQALGIKGSFPASASTTAPPGLVTSDKYPQGESAAKSGVAPHADAESSPAISPEREARVQEAARVVTAAWGLEERDPAKEPKA